MFQRVIGAVFVLLIATVVAPTAQATTVNLTGVGPFNNIVSTIDLAITCGGPSCSVVDNGSSIGVSATSDGNDGVDIVNAGSTDDEYLQFTFSSVPAGGYITLDGITLTGPDGNATTLDLTSGTQSGGYITNITNGATLKAAGFWSLTGGATQTFSSNNVGLIFRIGATGASSDTQGFDVLSLDFTFVPTPEPATYGLVGLTLVGLGALKFRRARRR